MVPRILIADDDPDIRQILTDWLTRQGYETFAAADGHRALRLAETQAPHLALLDVVMPGPSGMDLAARLRERHPQLGVIIITGHGTIPDAVEAMKAGAVDYLTKPLRVGQVSTVVEAALVARAGAERVLAGDLVIDLGRREVNRRGRSISLAKLEFDLLAYLVRQRGRVVSYDELLGQVWGCAPETGNLAQVRNGVKRLRKKLGDDPDNPRYFVTVRGVGYRWATPTNPAPSGDGEP